MNDAFDYIDIEDVIESNDMLLKQEIEEKRDSKFFRDTELFIFFNLSKRQFINRISLLEKWCCSLIRILGKQPVENHLVSSIDESLPFIRIEIDVNYFNVLTLLQLFKAVLSNKDVFYLKIRYVIQDIDINKNILMIQKANKTRHMLLDRNLLTFGLNLYCILYKVSKPIIIKKLDICGESDNIYREIQCLDAIFEELDKTSIVKLTAEAKSFLTYEMTQRITEQTGLYWKLNTIASFPSKKVKTFVREDRREDFRLKLFVADPTREFNYFVDIANLSKKIIKPNDKFKLLESVRLDLHTLEIKACNEIVYLEGDKVFVQYILYLGFYYDKRMKRGVFVTATTDRIKTTKRHSAARDMRDLVISKPLAD